MQSAAFVYFGVVRPSLSFRLTADIHGAIGTIIVVYAMVVYPIVGWATGSPASRPSSTRDCRLPGRDLQGWNALLDE